MYHVSRQKILIHDTCYMLPISLHPNYTYIYSVTPPACAKIIFSFAVT